jgi:hypothetical protein
MAILGFTFGLRQGFQFNGPHGGWGQTGQHRTGRQGAHQNTGTFEELASRQGQILFGDNAAFLSVLLVVCR